MMCRVVADKLLPLHHFAPSELLSTEEPSHNTNDIIPDILPEPYITTSRQDLVTLMRRSDIATTLTTYLGLNLSPGDTQSVSLQSESVKRYTLANPAQLFNRLMTNELYARDVTNLLRTVRPEKAYLVVGFLTVTGAVWKRNQAHEHSAEVKFSVPVGDIVSIGAQAGLDAGVSLANEQGTGAQRTMHVAEEEIFAVAYCKVKLKREFSRNAPHLMKTIAFGQAKRNKGHHLTFGDDEDEMEASSDEEDNVEKGIVLVVDEDDDGSSTPNMYERVEGLNSNQAFEWPEGGFDV